MVYSSVSDKKLGSGPSVPELIKLEQNPVKFSEIPVPDIKTGTMHSVPELKKLAGLPAGEAFASNVAPCLIKKTGGPE